jgi:hypothetical protein
MADFQATFSMGDQCSGRFVLVLMPRPPGPRNWGQFPAGNGVPEAVQETSRVAANALVTGLILNVRIVIR